MIICTPIGHKSSERDIRSTKLRFAHLDGAPCRIGVDTKSSSIVREGWFDVAFNSDICTTYLIYGSSISPNIRRPRNCSMRSSFPSFRAAGFRRNLVGGRIQTTGRSNDFCRINGSSLTSVKYKTQTNRHG